MKRVFYISFLLIIQQIAVAQNNLPPKWIHQQTFVGEDCDFILIQSSGESSINDARTAAMTDLRDKILHTDIVSVNQLYADNSHDVYSSSNDKVNIMSSQKHDGWLEIKVEGVPTNIQSKRIDEYSYKKGNGLEYYALIALPGKNSNIDLSRLTPTTSYASDPTTWGLSLIPGAAQMHKGSYVKGGIIMGGSVALVGGIIAFENIRANNMSKISQTHSADVKKTYNNNANNAALGRNICIGGLAALYVYNILDAIIAPGARRIIVTPSATADGQYGLSASLSF